MSTARLRPGGFTLIEMLVVVALIAAAAAASLLVTGQRSQQLRRETTEQRMADIVRAVVGNVTPVRSGLSGFVVDNGRLPASLRELTARDALVDAAECDGSTATTEPALFSCYRTRFAIFDPTPAAADGAPDGSGDEADLSAEAGAALPKGMRRYLDTLDSGFRLRDGWGNRALGGDDDSNFGWQLSTPAAPHEPWLLSSLGSDNALDATNPPPSPDLALAGDITRGIRLEDWSVDIQGWTVRLVNATGGDLSGGEWVGASLLVWENRPGGGVWRRFTTGLRDSGLPAGESADLTFPAGGWPGGGAATQVPAGVHLLVGVRSPNAVAHDADDEVLKDVDGAAVLAQVRLFPGGSRPEAELVLR